MIEKSKDNIATLRACIEVFSSSDRKRIIAVVILQILLGLLDLVGVVLIGMIGALTVSGIQSGAPSDEVNQAINLLGLDAFTFQQQTAILATVATTILVGRTVLSVIFTRKILFFISRRSAIISGNLISRLFQLDSLQISRRTIQETIYSSTTGVVAVTLGVVGTSVAMIADASLFIVMALGLIFVDLPVAIFSFILFAVVGFVLYKVMNGRAAKLGVREANLNVLSNERISEVLTSYREATIRSRRTFYAKEISDNRYRLSDVLAELAFMPSISKYVIEGTMIIGGLSIAALQFAIKDAEQAVSTLAIFLVAGTRIAPAILRVQQGSISIKSSLGTARPTLELLAELPAQKKDPQISLFRDKYPGLEERIVISNLTFFYPGSMKPALSGISLEIAPGTTCAIVGPSGSGKTTLVDIMLGMFEPSSGFVSISGKHPVEVVREFPGSIAYVPQDVSIIHGTIRENVALGYPIADATDERVMGAIQIGQLEDLIKKLPDGLDSSVGSRGSKLSGGQRQRLGIARAMFTKPKLLVLDESTSALDAQVEVLVSNSLNSINYNLTKIIIAHRLSTVRNADKVVYLDNGVVLASGSFDEVRKAVPDFDAQAKLMGL
jgi:ABC-type multidrug transport system fused ATPase/permease subunit